MFYLFVYAFLTKFHFDVRMLPHKFKVTNRCIPVSPNRGIYCEFYLNKFLYKLNNNFGITVSYYL